MSENKNLGDDPLDPHGDGTIEPGDPMWAEFERMMTTGEAVIGNRNDDGSWNVDYIPPAGIVPGDTRVPRPSAKRWWQFWRKVRLDNCHGGT